MGLVSSNSPDETTHRRPSVRRRLLAFLLIPTLLLMILDTGFVYRIALQYSNHVHDRDLGESARGLANAYSANWPSQNPSLDAGQLFEFSQPSRNFYAIQSDRRGFVSGNHALADQSFTKGGAAPVFFDARVAGLSMRAASINVLVEDGSSERLTVTVAETLRDRQEQAREILLLTILVESLPIALLMILVWQGVRFGLRILDAPIRRLALRERNLAPISGPDMPIEVLPLTRTIDALFERVASLVEMQERFVADAAHQLRTPLTGLSLQVERALSTTSEQDRRNALHHVQALVMRMTRNANQLLSLARAQVPAQGPTQLVPVDLASWLPVVVSSRIPEAIRAGVDLGYEAACTSAMVAADEHSLRELIDNLIDNAIAHVSRAGTITVGLLAVAAGQVAVTVDDDGPGVATADLPRLGERFFRAPGSADGGSGLGLAIVRRIADTHHARLVFDHSALGGLRVMVFFSALGTPILGASM